MSFKLSCFKQHGQPLAGPLTAVVFTALATAGCGHTSEQTQPTWYAGNSYAGGPRQTAAAVPIPVEMEDDGRPAQLPPRADVPRTADNPNEPWSPNYGGPARTPVTPSAARGQATRAEPPARRVSWVPDGDR
jgi:hypothetical protein